MVHRKKVHHLLQGASFFFCASCVSRFPQGYQFDFSINPIVVGKYHQQVHKVESFLSSCRAKLIDLAVSLLPGLNEDEIAVLFKAIQPVLKVVN